MTSACKLVFLLTCYFLPLFSSVHGKCLSDQRSYLLQFRNASQSSLNWNESMDCCKWGGVACDRVGHVISLNLDNKEISTRNEDWKSIFNLQHLEELNLFWSSFGFITIPVELYNLTRLKYLNLSGSGFTGQIPIGLSKLSSLVTLDLSNAGGLEVTDPGGLDVLFQNLTQLKQLYLAGVNISAQGNSWCNALSSLSKLQVLSLIGCELSGPILPSLSNLSSLTTIQLDGNPLNTTIPDYFSNFTKLRILSLTETGLLGQFPEKFFQIPTLESVDLSDNKLLGGSLPQFLKTVSLKEMTLKHTNFSGSLPDSIGYLKALYQLDLSFSNFSGAIPSSFTDFPEMVILILRNNNFNGSIPSFSMSPKLGRIDLSYNAFTGALSSTHFEGLNDLYLVDLGYNSLSGSFPLSLFALPSLAHIRLSNNHFDGEIEEFQNVSSSLLEELDLSDNNFVGFLPKSFFYIKRLRTLDLSFNSFNGTLGLDIFNTLEYLNTLIISHNNLSIDASCSTTSTCLSSFPQVESLGLASCNLKMFPDLRNQTGMIYLDLSLNSITGEIPNWIWSVGTSLSYNVNLSCNLLVGLQKPFRFPQYINVLDLHANLLTGDIPLPDLTMGAELLEYVDYSNNNFNTSIPSNIGEYIFYTKFFSLSHSNIHGDVPKSICNGTLLTVLNLSNNFLRGKIPKCLFRMVNENFGVLNLSGNKLDGNISDTFQHNCGLRTLDLSRNSLRGKIPISLANCKSLQVLNIGNNYLEDKFPCTLINGPDLSVLILRSNMFHGEINCSWGIHSLPSLQILDISYNNLSGSLPPQLFLNCRGMIVADSTGAPPLQFGISDSLGWVRNMYYQDSVKLVMKGTEVELVKILTIYKTLDFSCNHFEGKIPTAIGELLALYTLNLSHNALTGIIPRSFGKLEQLGSLDLSTNELTGRVPTELGDLTFLSVLNLSYNQLVGKIPDGRQLQTFLDSSFLGNKGLCGFPLNVSCDRALHKNGSSVPGGPFEKKGIEWEFVSAALGLSVGIGIILLMNFLNPTWWQKFNSLIIQFLILRVFGVDVLERSYRNPIGRL